MENESRLTKLLHRDDLDADVARSIERRMGELFPGMRMVCSGDMPEGSIPPKVQAEIDRIEAKHQRSLNEIRCIDCDCQVDNYPPPSGGTEEEFDAWWKKNITDAGWRTFSNGSDLSAFQCPVCDILEENS